MEGENDCKNGITLCHAVRTEDGNTVYTLETESEWIAANDHRTRHSHRMLMAIKLMKEKDLRFRFIRKYNRRI